MTNTEFSEQPSIDQLVLVAEDAPHGWRNRQGERLDLLFEERCDYMLRYGGPDRLAVDTGDLRLTYDELDRRANKLARYLRLRGAKPGDRIALLFDQAVHSYIGMLAVLKINAAYVPLDVGFPADRMAYIISDAGVNLVLSLSGVTEKVPVAELGADVAFVDLAARLIDEQDERRLLDVERGATVADLAYIIYTSGSTGRPKGVAIDHPSICNFVRVAAEVYGIRPRDRVYQGLTIAFDFSVEEIWVPWASGATLVPKPAGGSLLGQDLHDFLTGHRVTALCCVPTLLATLEDDLPLLRFLLVSGEACPQDLISRWYRPDRRFLNVYGPTEATVTATWTELQPDKPVTIGVPLPTYVTVILDVDNPHRALPHGETGEIGIAGIGLALGYLNREDLTDKAFIDDFLNIPANPSGRIYRTGDLGRVNADGEIEYQGRIDLQVKIRGYRIELTEIESVLLQVPGIAAAVVSTYEPVPGTVELVGYYSLRSDIDSIDQQSIFAVLRERLPKYMVPAFLECLDAIPLTPQDKADRKALPPPGQRASTAPKREVVAAATKTEQILATALAASLGLDTVSVDTDFFEELGANSLVLTQFSATLRKQYGLPGISIKEMYQNPTVRQLAALLGDAAGAPGRAGDGGVPVPAVEVTPGSSVRYALTGAGQLVLFLLGLLLAGWVLDVSYAWLSAAPDLPQLYGRATAFVALTFAGFVALPVLAKYLLVDSWRAAEIPLWSLRYLNFWFVKTLVQLNPMVLFVGSPLYVLYLRVLGAKIGRNVAIMSRTVPVATDLLTIGDGTVIHKDSSFSGYRAEAGRLRFGPVTVGRDALVGEKTVLDIGTSIGDGGQLGHSSSLHEGQAVPAGAVWHGSPAEPTDADYRTVEPLYPSTARKVGYAVLQLLGVLVAGPLVLSVAVALLTRVPALATVQASAGALLGNPMLYVFTLAVSFVLYFGALAAGLLVMITVPKVLHRLVEPRRAYPLYGVHYLVAGLVTRLTNSRFFMLLLGDSSFIVGYLRNLGYDLSHVVQTGSNFGTQMVADSPFLSRVGTGTIVSDGLSMMNAEYSNTSFRMSPVAIAENNFLGNDIAFPAGARVGRNVLLATKVMVPIDGPVRENVGLLGSPPFEIPRAVRRDAEIDYLNDPAEVARRLAGKNRHNAGTIATVLMLQWLRFAADLVLAVVAFALFNRFGTVAVAAALLAITVFNVVYPALLERAVLGFRPLTPQFCSIYDRYFWGHERLWKVYITPMFTGTPFQSFVWRLAGVRMGRRVFDDGCSMPEKSLVSIGDDVVLNAGSVIQCHSLEDGYFKSGYTVVEAGATVGVKAFVHYGVTMGAGSVLECDAFLLKGEEMAPGARWRGNPATEVRLAAPPAVQVPAGPAGPAPAASRLLLPASATASANAPMAATSRAALFDRGAQLK
ncbi:MAG TPA: Pls/PosA family non-ribosomal peptide synthetase [Pseudonocardia sp.]|nr:Pls/PosA family non-ribosomal peptide synthetase [Pseudonocardia sp.]